MELAFLRFFESLPAALAVGLLLLPRLIDEDGARFNANLEQHFLELRMALAMVREPLRFVVSSKPSSAFGR